MVSSTASRFSRISYLSYLSADSLHAVLIRKTFYYNESCEIQQMLTMYTTTGIKQSCVWRLCPGQIETLLTAKTYGSMCSWAKPCLISTNVYHANTTYKHMQKCHANTPPAALLHGSLQLKPLASSSALQDSYQFRPDSALTDSQQLKTFLSSAGCCLQLLLEHTLNPLLA